MHMLMDESEEFGTTRGLGLLPGRVRKLGRGPGAKVPHVGWAALDPPAARSWEGTLLERLDPGASVYFTHSLAVEPVDPAVVTAEAVHGQRRFAAVVEQGSIGGTQFHPEKSGPVGLAILARFVAG
jgi:glutamine amidotransferase